MRSGPEQETSGEDEYLPGQSGSLEHSPCGLHSHHMLWGGKKKRSSIIIAMSFKFNISWTEGQLVTFSVGGQQNLAVG